MGDLYKCKKCGQLLYGAGVPELNGEAAWNIMRTIEQQGYYDASEPVAFLESDFSDFLVKEDYVTTIRYRAYSTFSSVMENMRKDGVTMGTKVIRDGEEHMICSTCHSDRMFHRLGSLPTTYVDGKWDDYVDSDHTWYILSDSPGGIGAFTELERRELNSYIDQEDRLEAQREYEELIQECHSVVKKAPSSFAKQVDVDLTNYFKVLVNIKTDIQMLETRLFDLLVDHVVNDRDYFNSSSKTEETVMIELEKNRKNLSASIARLEKEVEFVIRPDWLSGLEYPVEPQEPVLIMPKEPEYRQPGLFNKKQVAEENAALRARYESAMADYQNTKRQYEEAMAAYRKACQDYEDRKEQIFRDEESKWNHSPDIVAKKEELAKLREKLEEVLLHEKDPLLYADDTLRNSSPVRIKRMYDAEIERNQELLKKAYQIEVDLQSIMFVMPKYLDIVAVSKIYEYLVTGKCTQLTGAKGAYHMYESEIRSNRVFPYKSQSESLDTMAHREYTIYSMLSSVSNVLNEITAKTTAAVDEIRNTAETEKTEEYEQSADAYYSLIDTELNVCTEFLAEHNVSLSDSEEEEKPEQSEEANAETAAAEEEKPEEANAETAAAEETQPEEAERQPEGEPEKKEAEAPISEDASQPDDKQPEETEAEEKPVEILSAPAEETLEEEKAQEAPKEPEDEIPAIPADSADLPEFSVLAVSIDDLTGPMDEE